MRALFLDEARSPGAGDSLRRARSRRLFRGPGHDARGLRQAEPMTVSKRFLTMSTQLLYWSMYPLMSAILLDFYLIGSLILDSRLLSLLVAVALSGVFLVLWVFLPRVRRLQRMLSGPD